MDRMSRIKLAQIAQKSGISNDMDEISRSQRVLRKHPDIGTKSEKLFKIKRLWRDKTAAKRVLVPELDPHNLKRNEMG
jgi:hypothetical protein